MNVFERVCCLVKDVTSVLSQRDMLVKEKSKTRYRIWETAEQKRDEIALIPLDHDSAHRPP